MRKDSYQDCITLLSEGKFSEAKECLETGLDNDLQPHRATRRTNQIVKDIAAFYQIPLADVDKEIVAKAKNQIPRIDLFPPKSISFDVMMASIRFPLPVISVYS